MSEKDDYEAACELASEMFWTDAARFIRAETGVSLREGIYVCERLADQFPSSPLARSWAARAAAFATSDTAA